MLRITKGIIDIINYKIVSIFQERNIIRLILQSNDLVFEEYTIGLDDTDYSDSSSIILDITFDNKSILNEKITKYSLEEKIIKKSTTGSELYYVLEINTPNSLITALFKVMSQTIPNGVKIKKKYNANELITINRDTQTSLKGFKELNLFYRYNN